MLRWCNVINCLFRSQVMFVLYVIVWHICVHMCVQLEDNYYGQDISNKY